MLNDNNIENTLLTLFTQHFNGDRFAEFSLYKKLKELFMPVCQKYCCDDYVAEEAFQIGTLTAFKSFPTYKGNGSVYSWLYSIYRFSVYNKIREDVKLKTHINFDCDRVDQESNNVDYEFFDTPEVTKAKSYFASLSEQDKKILYMREQEDMIFEDIAKAVGMHRCSVMARYKKCITQLKHIHYQYKVLQQ